jgi:hypothetical protein
MLRSTRRLMPALNYKKEFADKVESGEKKQTIRALRKDGRNPKPGQTLYHYTGMRTKYCRKLGEGICTSVEPICIETNSSIVIGVTALPRPADERRFARADGFETETDFYDFFRKTHGLPFWGLLIKWDPQEVGR